MIPFEIPSRFLADVAAGTVYRLGTTLRDRSTGRTVGLLQETRLLQEVVGNTLGSGVNPPSLLLSAVQLGSSAWANVQLEQVKAILHTLQMLNAASLAVSVVGIGVSAVGFAMVLHRLEGVEHLLQDVHKDIVASRRAAERADKRLADSHRAVMDSLLYRAEEAWKRSDAETVWRTLDGPLDAAQRYFRSLVGKGPASSIFLDRLFSLEEAIAAYESALMLAAVRLQTLLLLEEKDAALHYAQELRRWQEESFHGLYPTDLAEARTGDLAQANAMRVDDTHVCLLRYSEQFFEVVRAVQQASVDRPELFRILKTRGIGGRAYIEAVREREDAPLLLLPFS